MNTELVCWKCGTPLTGVPMPLSRLSVCLKCSSELYVCKLCEFHEPKLRQGCLEDRAEHVQEKEHANFCDYFRPRPGAHVPRDRSKAEAARAGLDALFGGGTPEAPADPARAELDKLFGTKSKD
ncbi:MAG: hypothetical protein ACHQAU_00550 [Gammaproteobacteria bacterium]